MSKSPAAGWGPDAPGPAQLKEFFAQVESGRISKASLQRFLRCAETPVAVVLGDIRSQLSQYRRFLKKELGIKEFNPKRIPAQVPGFDRLLGVPEGITPSAVIKAMRAKGIQVWTHSDLYYLDKVVSDREPTEDYVIRLSDRREADEKLKNLSSNQLKQQGIKGITLIERLLYGFKYFLETGDHLDEKNITLCSGSRHPYGYVPSVYWDPDYGEVDVYWFGPGRACSDLRSRQAIS